MLPKSNPSPSLLAYVAITATVWEAFKTLPYYPIECCSWYSREMLSLSRYVSIIVWEEGNCSFYLISEFCSDASNYVL